MKIDLEQIEAQMQAVELLIAQLLARSIAQQSPPAANAILAELEMAALGQLPAGVPDRSRRSALLHVHVRRLLTLAKTASLRL